MKQKFKEIPHSWLVAGFMASMVILRAFGIDSVVTASLASLTGYLLGTKLEQIRQKA